MQDESDHATALRRARAVTGWGNDADATVATTTVSADAAADATADATLSADVVPLASADTVDVVATTVAARAVPAGVPADLHTRRSAEPLTVGADGSELEGGSECERG